MTYRNGIRHLMLVPLAMSLLLSSLHAGAKVNVGRQVESSKRVSIDRIDHRVWDALLRHYVDENGNVNYQAWKKSEKGRNGLDQYLDYLSTADPGGKASRDGRLAFWINAYNAVTIKGILREYPTSSIRNHTAYAFGYNIWDDLLLIVGGEKYSLNDMEHKILRKMNEPRIHFAVVCASKGCPRLRAEAYRPDQVDTQLEDNALDFFARSQNFRFDTSRGRFQLSSILKWYGDDFGESNVQQLKAISKYLPTSASRQAAAQGIGRVGYLDYDWTLNDRK